MTLSTEEQAQHDQDIRRAALLAQLKNDEDALAQAIQLLKPWCDRDDVGGADLYWLGKYYLSARNHSMACHYLELAREKAPNEPETFGPLARAYKKLGELAKAKETLVTGHALAPQHAGIAESLALIYISQSLFKRAEETINTTLQFNRHNDRLIILYAEILIKRNKPAEAEKILTDVLSRPDFEKNVSNACNHLALSRFDLGAYTRAIDALDRGLDLFPNNVYIAANRIRILDLCGKPNAAVAYGLNCLRIAPTRLQLLSSLGRVYMRHGDYAEAGKHLARAHEIAPEATFTSTLLAGALNANGKTNEARDILEKAHAADPAHFECGKSLANHYLNDGDVAAFTGVMGKLAFFNRRTSFIYLLSKAAFLCDDDKQLRDSARVGIEGKCKPLNAVMYLLAFGSDGEAVIRDKLKKQDFAIVKQQALAIANNRDELQKVETYHDPVAFPSYTPWRKATRPVAQAPQPPLNAPRMSS